MLVDDLNDSMKRFRNDFVILYHTDKWSIKSSHDEEPNFPFNNVSRCNLDHLLLIEHSTKVVEVGWFKLILVHKNFTMTLDHLRNNLLFVSIRP